MKEGGKCRRNLIVFNCKKVGDCKRSDVSSFAERSHAPLQAGAPFFPIFL
jgi:hypothetical protein